MTAPLLEARDLVATRDGRRVLDGATLAVRPGARVALVGPNGSGKSTLLLHLNGVLRPVAGTVTLDGVAQGYRPRELRAWRQQVGLVLQDADDQLFAGTVFEDVSFGPLNLGHSPDAAHHLAERALVAVGALDLWSRAPHQLSAGERRRVALAGVLAMEPAILLLDEPTIGLDAEGERLLAGVLERLSAAGTSLLLATHDLALVRAWADEVVPLQVGRTSHPVSPSSVSLPASVWRPRPVACEGDRPVQARRRVWGQLLVCQGCCCGNTPRGKPAVPVEWLKATWRERGLRDVVHLTISGCLGPCELTNVVALTTDAETIWLGGLDTEHYAPVIDWVADCAAEERHLPLPEALRGFRFQRYRDAASPALRIVAGRA